MSDTISTYDQLNLLDAAAVPADTAARIRQVAGEHASWSSAHISDYLAAQKHIDVTVAQVKEVLGR